MKNSFDDLLKRKLEQQHFAVDENHRQDMVDLLDNQKRRKPFPFWWLGSFIALAVFAGLLFLNKNDEASTALETQRSDDFIAGTSNKTDKVPTETIIQKDPNGSIESRTKELNSNEGLVDFETKTSTQQISPVSTTQKGKTVALQQLKDRNSTSSPTTSASLKDQKSKAVRKPDLASNEYVLTPISDEARISIALSETVSENEMMYPQKDQEVAIEEQMVSRAIVPFDALQFLEMSGIDYTSHFSMHSIQMTKASISPLFVFGEVGVGFVLGSNPDYTAGWKLHAGAGLGYKLSSRFQLSLSAGYLFQNGGFDFQKLSSVNQPGFGARSSFNSLTPDKLHFVYARMGAQLNSRRHIFASHVGMQVLYGAQGNIVTIVDDQFAAGLIETTEYAWLKTNGLRKVNWCADLSYGYHLTPRFSIAAGAEYYFNSIAIEDLSLEMEGYTWSGAFSPIQPFIHINYLLYGRL